MAKGELTNQVIAGWKNITPPFSFKPDIKSSLGKLTVKNEILTPSYTVSIAPVSYKVEVDPFVYSDAENVWLARWANLGLLQSVSIKATGNLSFKGDKEVAFKTKSEIEYSSNDDDEAKSLTKDFITMAVLTAGITSIAAEVLAILNQKSAHDALWFQNMAFSRILFLLFSYVQYEKIKIEFATAVKAAADAKKADEDLAAATAQTEAINAILNPRLDALIIHAKEARRLQTIEINRRLRIQLDRLDDIAHSHQSQIKGLREAALLAAAGRNAPRE